MTAVVSRARAVVERLRAEATSWPGVVSLVLHGSASRRLDEPLPYQDVDLLVVFEDAHLADGHRRIERFFDEVCAEPADGPEACLWRAQSGPMHPLRDLPSEAIVSLRNRPIVFFHVSVFSVGSLTGANGDPAPSPLLVSSWNGLPTLLGTGLGELHDARPTFADCLAGIEDSLALLRTRTRGYWHWSSAAEGELELQWAVADWSDFESYEMPAYLARWGLENFRRVVCASTPVHLPPTWRLIEFVSGTCVHDDVATIDDFLTHRETLRVRYSEAPAAFAAEQSDARLATAAERVLVALHTTLSELNADTGTRTSFRHAAGASEIASGRVLGDALPRLLAEANPDLVVVLIDAAAQRAYDFAGAVARWREPLDVQIVEPSAKSLEQLGALLARAEEAEVTHDSLYVVVGGGTVGNLGGMVASLACRGLPFVHVPTTLVAQLDSAIGMKQAVNGRRAKNYFGTFHAPLATLVEPLLLASLPTEHVVSGLVEGLKHGLCQSPELLAAVLAVDPCAPTLPQLTEIVERTIAAKLELLEHDPREMSVDQPLELGHKVGHAIEHLTAGQVPHGVCVAVGMSAEARFAARLGLVSEDAVAYLDGHARSLLRAVSPPVLPAEDVARQVARDNHRRRAGVPFVFLAGPQSPFTRPVQLSDDVIDVLADAIGQTSEAAC